MKQLRILLIVALVILASISFPALVQAGQLTTITVEVSHTQANGKAWDIAKGAPDLALCVTHSLVGTLCLPQGDQVNTIINAECPNSYQCRFSAEIPDKNFKISVVDVDVALNDLIGTGHCGLGETCEVGQATVSIGKGKGWW